jgi:hypothetical protein
MILELEFPKRTCPTFLSAFTKPTKPGQEVEVGSDWLLPNTQYKLTAAVSGLKVKRAKVPLSASVFLSKQPPTRAIRKI